ncbi:transient receptor potential cation channel subfamily M member 2-like [Pseudophryne corroboree]|uniref:transient receptor potential cation channel subfamily M member 2-like n=1 Tax=Pseudophryne corroboree TaxID=495146 RepID=UPI0030814D76
MGNTKSQAEGQDEVDGVEISKWNNLQSPYRPGTADGKKRKKTSPKFLNERNVDVLNSWVSRNIKKKECVTFIPQAPGGGTTCGCGQTRELHINQITVPELFPGTTWDPRKCVKEFPSDSHGDMTFTGTNRTWAKYVRASSDTAPSVLYDLMTQQWGLSAPSLLISVTGGAKNFNISPMLKTQFSRGLVSAAESTGAWIITGGTHAGVMKHVGEAVRDFSGGQQEIVLIGIATWGIVHNRKYLLSEAGGAPALYPMDEGSQGALCCLDNNHTHFILVDDGTHGRYGLEIPLRTQLEKFISQQTMQKGGTAIKIPIVCVVLEGGPGTLDTIYNSMCNNTPCVIVEGSGRVANIIAEVANLGSSKITISLIKEKMQNYFQESYDTFTETQIITWTKKVQDIVRMGSLLTILREERVVDQGMDVAILQALLKASHSSDHSGQENWDHQLKLAVSWNRTDIAEKEIFTEDWTWKPSDLYPSLMVSLIEDKPAFVHLLLDHGVSLSEFLTWDRLTDLYNNTDPSTLIYSKLERLATAEVSRKSLKSHIELHHVSSVLQEILGELTEPLYQKPKHPHKQSLRNVNIRMNGKVDVMKEFQDTQHLEHPVRDLLIWCVLQHRAELSEIFWNLTQDSVAGALMCTQILKALAKEEDDSANTEEMTALADVYEGRAVGVFSECYSNDEKRAENLLLHVSPKWGKTNILELAEESQAQIFMSHAGVQMFLTKTWWGRMSADNSFLQVLLCMFLFPLIYSGLIIYRKSDGNAESYITEVPTEKRNGSVRQDQRNSIKNNAPPGRGPRPDSCLWKFMVFFNAPIIKFWYNVVSYIGFLALFGYVLITDFQTYPSWREYLLYVWIFSFLTEELRQLFYDPDRRGFVIMSVQYITEFWNQVDTAALCLFAVGLICRLVRSDTVYVGRVILSLDFMIYCIRVMYIFTVNKVLGPKIIMLRRMMKDMFFFLFLLAIFIAAYGVAKQAILYDNESRLSWIFRNIVYSPYLTLFGQLPTDVDSLNFNPSQCSQTGNDSSLPLCVYNDGNGNTLFPDWLTIILMCLYLLIANILLLNLLIAMFSYTFSDVESHADQLWKFYRFGLIKEYNERPVAPPPFILFAHLYLVLKHVFCVRPARGHKLLRRMLDEGQESSLLSWESYMKDNYQQMQQQQDEQSQENLVKGTAESVSAVLRLLQVEKGDEGHQLEGRLAALEERMDQSTQYLSWIISALTENGYSSKTRILARPVHSVSTEADGKDTSDSDSNGEKQCLFHVNSRILQYPNSDVTRYPVPDEMVPWEVDFPDYNPPLYNAARSDRGTYDPKKEMEQKSRKYNAMDNLIDFRSFCGTYTVADGLPLNPMGRTGLRGVGSLRWFGPNHSLHPVLTRWHKKIGTSSVRKTLRKKLEVLVVKLKRNELWSLPGGTLDPGKKIPIKFQSLLRHEYLGEFLTLFDSGVEVFHGYLDDPRNTDNSWIETSAVNIHFNTKESLERLLQFSDLMSSCYRITSD